MTIRPLTVKQVKNLAPSGRIVHFALWFGWDAEDADEYVAHLTDYLRDRIITAAWKELPGSPFVVDSEWEIIPIESP